MANKLNLEWYVGTVGAGKDGSGQFLPLPRFSLLWLHSYVLRQSPTYLLLLSEKYDYCWGKYKNNWKGPTNCIPTSSDICQPAPLSEGYDNSQGKYRETKRQKMHSYVLRQSPTYLFLLSKIYNLWDQQNELKKGSEKRQDVRKITFLPPRSIPNIPLLLFTKMFWENNTLR